MGQPVTFQDQADQGSPVLLKTSGYSICVNDSEQQPQLLHPFLEGVGSNGQKSTTRCWYQSKTSCKSSCFEPATPSNRLQWSRTHRVWPQQRCNTVWFSEESRFLLHRADDRAKVYRRRHECFAANCVQEVDRFRGGSVMMWAAIFHTGKTDLVHVNGTLTAQRYCDEILQPHIVPIMQNNGTIFQHANARPHTARLTTTFLQTDNITLLPWPSKSPDLNSIEHLWDELDRRARQRQPAPQSLQQFVQALQAEWTNIPQQLI